MNKPMNKIILRCILTACIILIPFIFANYYVVNYFFEHGEYFHEYDELVLNILQVFFTLAAGLIIRNKSKSTIIENRDIARKYMLGSLIAFLVLVILYISDIYLIITESLQILDKAPLFLAVCWEQIFNGKFLLSLSLCIAICFAGKITQPRENLA